MEIMDLSNARIYVGTYAKYNNGSLKGEWIDLSDYSDLDEFLEYCRKLHKDESDPELMFQAWEEIPSTLISECNLNKSFFNLRESLEQLDSCESNAFWLWVENVRKNLSDDSDELIDDFRTAYIGCYSSKEEFATEQLDESSLSEFALLYFDYEKYADDLFMTDYNYIDGYVFYNN